MNNNGKKLLATIGGIMIAAGGGMSAMGFANDHMWNDYHAWVEPCEVGGIIIAALGVLLLLISVIGIITNTISKQKTVNPVSKADELRKYKELLDEGILTEEEYQTKKNQFLNDNK